MELYLFSLLTGLGFLKASSAIENENSEFCLPENVDIFFSEKLDRPLEDNLLMLNVFAKESFDINVKLKLWEVSTFYTGWDDIDMKHSVHSGDAVYNGYQFTPLKIEAVAVNGYWELHLTHVLTGKVEKVDSWDQVPKNDPKKLIVELKTASAWFTGKVQPDCLSYHPFVTTSKISIETTSTSLAPSVDYTDFSAPSVAATEIALTSTDIPEFLEETTPTTVESVEITSDFKLVTDAAIDNSTSEGPEQKDDHIEATAPPNRSGRSFFVQEDQLVVKRAIAVAGSVSVAAVFLAVVVALLLLRRKKAKQTRATGHSAATDIYGYYKKDEEKGNTLEPLIEESGLDGESLPRSSSEGSDSCVVGFSRPLGANEE